MIETGYYIAKERRLLKTFNTILKRYSKVISTHYGTEFSNKIQEIGGGGDSDAALKRAVRLADGYFPVEGDFTRLSELLARLARTAAEADRDPASIEINVMFGALFGAQMADPAAGIEQLASLGVDRIMVPAFFFAGPGGIDRLSEFGETLIPLANS